jgi:hypothetical protein
MRQSSMASVCIDGINQIRINATKSTVTTAGFNSTAYAARHGHDRSTGLSTRTRQDNGKPLRNTEPGYEEMISKGAR